MHTCNTRGRRGRQVAWWAAQSWGQRNPGPFEEGLWKILLWVWDFKPSLGFQHFYWTREWSAHGYNCGLNSINQLFIALRPSIKKRNIVSIWDWKDCLHIDYARGKGVHFSQNLTCVLFSSQKEFGVIGVIPGGCTHYIFSIPIPGIRALRSCSHCSATFVSIETNVYVYIYASSVSIRFYFLKQLL